MVASYTSSVAAPGQQVFTADGSFVVPAGVTSISALAVGHGGYGQLNPSGGAGRGGDLRYAITLAVTPGETLTITVPASSDWSTGPTSIKRSGTTLLAAACGGLLSATVGTSSTIGGNIGGGNGGNGRAGNGGEDGGGGAGGYSGNGGAGSLAGQAAGNGAGGAGGGGRGAGGGGGVGLLGAGSSGNGGASSNTGGSGGSGGANGGSGTGTAKSGGSYGGAPGYNDASGWQGAFSSGAVRIIWGSGRAYPSTGTADV